MAESHVVHPTTIEMAFELPNREHAKYCKRDLCKYLHQEADLEGCSVSIIQSGGEPRGVKVVFNGPRKRQMAVVEIAGIYHATPLYLGEVVTSRVAPAIAGVRFRHAQRETWSRRLQQSSPAAERWLDLVRFILPPRSRQGILGDLYEECQIMRAAKTSERTIVLWAIWQILLICVSCTPRFIFAALLGWLFARR